MTETDQERLARLEVWLHSRQIHPDFEYDVTKGPRKAWNDEDRPPNGDSGWVRNIHVGRDGWERFDYHEESYWMRPKPAPEPIP